MGNIGLISCNMTFTFYHNVVRIGNIIKFLCMKQLEMSNRIWRKDRSIYIRQNFVDSFFILIYLDKSLADFNYIRSMIF